MFFPGFGDGVNNSIGVAASTDPHGPYVDVAGRNNTPSDDPTIFLDDDGTAILCSSVSVPNNMPICGTLAADMVRIRGLQPGDFLRHPCCASCAASTS
jgi:hypothetical protein